MNTTQTQTETEHIKINEDQYKELNQFSFMAHRFIHVFESADYETRISFSNWKIESDLSWCLTKIRIETENIKSLMDHIEFLKASLIIELEESKDCRIHQDGKLFLDFEYEESKKESQKIINNCRVKISHSRKKIKDQSSDYKRITELKNYVKENIIEVLINE